MLFAGDFLASHSAKPENNWQKKMCAISGLNILGLSKNVGHLGLLERMLLASSTWASTPCLMTWKALGTPQGRLIFQLARLAPHTTDEGCGLLPTPQAGDERAALTGTQNQLMLSHVAKIWPTPTARCYKGGGGAIMRKDGKSRLDMLDWLVESQNQPGRLNPEWVEWLMGFPVGWTELKPLETPSSRKSQKSSGGQ